MNTEKTFWPSLLKGSMCGFVGAALCARPVAAVGDVTLTKVAEYDFAVDGCGGLAYAGGDQFYVLCDHNKTTGYAEIYPLTLGIDKATGAILSQTLGGAVQPGSLNDAEGLAFDPGSGALWVSDEAVPTISEFDMSGSPTGRCAPVPAIQREKKRANRSLESLTISGDGLTMWTANEQALTCDGKASDGSVTVKTVVRLTRFSRPTVADDWTASGEWAYKCDPCEGTTSSQSGLSGLCALPDGSLLALEREVSVMTSGRCRIYRVTPEALAAATEISAIAALDGNRTYKAVDKGTALVDFDNSRESGLFDYPMIVYEGICLGPRLDDGSLGVYLVSDGGDSKSQSGAFAYTLSRLCALRLSGLDVVTVNFSAPDGCTATPGGRNYRYLRGSRIAASVTGAGLEEGAYTNNGACVVSAAWTAGARAGSGAVTEITVTDDETTLRWTLSEATLAKTEIGSHDSFEGFAEGTLASAIPDWSGEAAVEALAYAPPTPPGYAMPRETHTRVLNAEEDDAWRTVTDNIAGNRRFDVMIQVRRAKSPLASASGPVRVQVGVDAEGRFCLWHLRRGEDGWTAGWTPLSETAYADGDWVRLGVEMADANGVGFCRVRLNGSVCPTSAGFRTMASDAPAPGVWHRLANGTAADVSEVGFMGTRVDDLLVTTDAFSAEHTGATSADGIDFAWLDAMDLPRDPTAAAPNLPGHTVKYLYESGVAPYSDSPLAITRVTVGSDGKVRLAFNGYKGDSPEAFYRVLRSENLKDWTPLNAGDGAFDGDRASWSSVWEGVTGDTPASALFYKVEATPTAP